MLLQKKYSMKSKMNEITHLIISIFSISYTHTSPLDEVLSNIIKVVLGRKEDLQQDVP